MNVLRARAGMGLALMSASLLLAMTATPVAVAAEGEEVPEDLTEVEVTRRAYWNADNSKYSDNVATSQFPPEAVCLVQPQACFFPEGDQDPTSDAPTGGTPLTEEDGAGAAGNAATAEINEQQQALLATMAENDSGVPPEDPVPPDSSPVSVAFGKPNYRAAIEFELPSVPAGEQLDRLAMVLTEGSPTYSNESPAFRQAVLAALTCASDGDGPGGRCTMEEFEKVDPAELRGDEPLTVEVCPIEGEWKAGRAQDEDTLPEVNCLYTALGTPITDGETTFWVFDLTFMASAWESGTLTQNGLLLRPGAAENFAYGDPETTYSKQVTFEPTVQLAMTTSEEQTLSAPPTLPPPSSTSSTPSSGNTGSSDVFAPPPPTSTGSVSAPSGGTPSTTSQPAPAVSQPTTEQPAVAGDGGQQANTLAAGTPLGEPQNPWWLWLLIIPFAGGAWLMNRALEAQAVGAATAATRSTSGGALTRLLERQAAARSSQLVTG